MSEQEPDYLESDADLYQQHHHTCECSLCKPELVGPVSEKMVKIIGMYQLLEVWRVEDDI